MLYVIPKYCSEKKHKMRVAFCPVIVTSLSKQLGLILPTLDLNQNTCHVLLPSKGIYNKMVPNGGTTSKYTRFS